MSNALQTKCQPYDGHIDRAGYGRQRRGGKLDGAHRFAYIDAHGPIPDGFVIDHLCGNPPCVNPEHLEAVTQRQNLLRGNTIAAANAQKTHCPQGHPYDEANTSVSKSDGSRKCRACARDSYHKGRAL